MSTYKVPDQLIESLTEIGDPVPSDAVVLAQKPSFLRYLLVLTWQVSLRVIVISDGRMRLYAASTSYASADRLVADADLNNVEVTNLSPRRVQVSFPDGPIAVVEGRFGVERLNTLLRSNNPDPGLGH